MTESANVEIIDRQLALRLLPKRDEHAHKWSVGGVLIVGGAPGYIGAPALCAMAAGRSGAGIVNLAIPRASVGVTASIVPEAVFIPLPETDGAHGVQKAIEDIAPIAEKCRCLVVGPGLSRDEPAGALVGALLGDSPRSASRSLGFGSTRSTSTVAKSDGLLGKDLPAVVDADALHWLSERDEWWTKVQSFSLILTPHVGEFAGLTGQITERILDDPQEAVQTAAAKWQQTVVLKAGRTWISDGTQTRSVVSAVPALATAGSGDVLAGSIAAFVAQGLIPIDAASLALYAGSEGAKKLVTELSTLGVVASDLPRAIATILADLELNEGTDQ